MVAGIRSAAVQPVVAFDVDFAFHPIIISCCFLPALKHPDTQLFSNADYTSQFTLQGTNTYLLGSGPSRLLIDTGSGEKKWIDTVRTVLNSPTKQPLTISTCLLTHWHHDHLGGVRDLEQLSEELSSSHNMKVYKNQPSWNPDGLIDPSRVLDIHDGQKFSVDGNFEIQAVHTPGHAKDHMVFQITASPDPNEIGALFTADNVLGHGTAVFEDLQLYLESLNVMKKRVVDAIALQQQDNDQPAGISGGPNSSAHTPTIKKRAYPGHGQYIDDAIAKFDEYIAHRRMREEEALNVLKYGTVKAPDSSGPLVADSITTIGESDSNSDTEANLTAPKEIVGGKEWSSMEMVRVIYRHYPENLWEPAERGLLMVLEKLKKDGRVVNVGGQGDGDGKGRWRVSEKATL
ncbi:hypothetical protein H2200_004751 [Cladophialophora chaetospira]|uniref:Metallo-beta-lactamase domain-containing protein n=1 Tax=Cladophialophora chaetospira TaxID=386627 RepID=A0AA39CJR9_9EURO|nr:hypothetical protein H2200_004751 [Cladophialophora chaetospira]